MNTIYTEYSQRIQAGAVIIQNVNATTKTIKTSINTINGLLSSASTQIGSLNDAITGFGASMLEPLVNTVWLLLNIIIAKNC